MHSGELRVIDKWKMMKRNRWRKQRAYGGALYIVACAGYYKIGITHQLTKRLKYIQSDNALEVTAIHSFMLSTRKLRPCESYLHWLYTDKHVRGEWYMLTIDDVDFLKRLSKNNLLSRVKRWQIIY